MRIHHLVARLKEMAVLVTGDFVIHHVLSSLPIEFEQLKISYKAQRDKWGIDKLITICIKEKSRMKNNKAESA